MLHAGQSAAETFDQSDVGGISCRVDRSEQGTRVAGQRNVGDGWMVFDGRRWRFDTQLRRVELAKTTARLIAREAHYLENDRDKRDRVRFGNQSLSKAALDRMLELAKSLLIVDDRKLDADSWMLNTLSGTIDLRLGVILPHDHCDLLTKMAPVAADMNARCPQFEAFLARIMSNDDSLVDYIWRAVDYTLTGDVSEQAFFFCYGKGRNGKSTFVNLIRRMLGDYGAHTPTETFVVKQFDNAIPADLARLAGVRMVTAIEANYNRPLDETKIKPMTGGEPITARFVRQNYFEFDPLLKIWFVANDFPRVRATSDAFWRRVHMIPFSVEIPASEVDPALPSKLENELPGILAWAVRGCLEWQRIGLAPPPAVVRATDLWREGLNVVKRFVNECVIFERDSSVTGSGMYAAFKKWCEEHGEQPLPIQKYKRQMQELDITHKRLPGSGQRVWKGVKLRY